MLMAWDVIRPGFLANGFLATYLRLAEMRVYPLIQIKMEPRQPLHSERTNHAPAGACQPHAVSPASPRRRKAGNMS
jgi:hypothetical protein